MGDFDGHTPGPWQVIHESDGAWGDNWSIVQADNALEDVAEMVVSAENARLIAAAPDLLAERDRLRAEVERLQCERDEYAARCVEFSENAAALVEEMSKAHGTTWGQVKAAMRALGDMGDRKAHRSLANRVTQAEAEVERLRPLVSRAVGLISGNLVGTAWTPGRKAGDAFVTDARAALADKEGGE